MLQRAYIVHLQALVAILLRLLLIQVEAWSVVGWHEVSARQPCRLQNVRSLRQVGIHLTHVLLVVSTVRLSQGLSTTHVVLVLGETIMGVL